MTPLLWPVWWARDLRLLLQQEQAEARMGLGQGQRGGEPDDAAPDDREIGALDHGRENTTTLSPLGRGQGEGAQGEGPKGEGS